MNTLVLIGIVIIVIGFMLKLDVLSVVLVAGIATGLAANLPFTEILKIMGKAFVDNRIMSIFFISFPVIAILERYGLRERSAHLIGNIKKASAGKVLSLYTIIRSLAGALSIRIGGHVQFIRPLIFPMAEAAGNKDKKNLLSDNEIEKLKGLSAAMENYANFFSQNIFVGAPGVLLIYGTLKEAGYEVPVEKLALYSIPIGLIAAILAIVQGNLYDKKIKETGGK